MDLFYNSIAKEFNQDPLSDTSFWFEKGISALCLLLGCLFCLPFTLPRTSGTILRYSYILPILALIYVIILLAVQAPDYIQQKNEWSWYKGDFKDYLLNIGVFIYGYNCITAFNTVVNQLGFVNTKRLDKISNRTMISLMIMYLPIGIVAYMSFGNAIGTKDLFLMRDPIPGSSDWAMKIGKFLMIPSCWITLIVNAFPFKDQCFDTFKLSQSRRNNIILTIIALLGTATIGWGYAKIVDWFSLLGAFCGAFLNCYFPGMLFYAQFKGKAKWRKIIWIDLIWMACLMTILMACSVMVAFNVVQKML